MNNPHSLVRHTLPFFYACCFVLVLAGCASPETTGEDGTAQASNRECRTTGSAGTKMKRSVCMSTEEWAIADASNQEREDLQNEYFRRARESATQGPAPEFATTPSVGL